MCHFFEVVSVIHINKRCRTLWIINPSHVNQKSVYGVPDQNGLKSIFPAFLKHRRPKLESFNVLTANAVDQTVSEGTHQAAWLRIVVVNIRKTQFSRDEAHFSVSYEMNDGKKLSQHVFEEL